MTQVPGEPESYRPLYDDALRARWAWGGRLSIMPGRERLSDDALRAFMDEVLEARPDAWGTGEHLVALWLHRIICTGPRWQRLWQERVSAQVQRATPGENHPLAEVVHRAG